MPTPPLKAQLLPSQRILPLQHGDRLTRDEFERRYEAMPELKKAELIDGMVFLASDDGRQRRIDQRIPPLENGDSLTRAEFERRWDNMPDLKNAELINGLVFMSSPVSATRHGIPHSNLLLWLGLYCAGTPAVRVADNSTLRLLPDDDCQPDAMLLIPSDRGGGSRFEEHGYVEGVPELVAEVAASSASYDLNLKLDSYRRNRIPEYVAWRVLDAEITWLVLREGQYEPLSPDPDGILRSEILPGLWLDPAALLRGDLAAVIQVLQQGLATPEHAVFVARLQQAKERT